MSAREEPESTSGLDLTPRAHSDCGVGCTEALDRLFEYLDSELVAPDADRVRQHLDECKGCLEEFDVEAVVKKIVRRSCQEAAPAQLRVRIHERIVSLRVGESTL
ncbi:MAG TPA: mycothiol system anti-sigma-R factor [Cellulomonas sp.]|uniref:mycothiol system anti-sigma-R factor n=1 Tax=Cellulomonas sp. TaxID=40001 RepID=UPI002E34F700|nr:mycothiol system anti-sigma-R factor [Cellulomonas sp.]HEX5331573.1 mycothiol system anti-sigma-R factor [Cellulomonas sp.]